MKQLLTVLILFFNTLILFSQTPSLEPKPKRFDVSGMVGWNFVGNTSYSKVKNATIYTGAVDYILNDRTHIELNYSYMSSDIRFRANSYNSVSSEYTLPYYQGFVQGGLMRVYQLRNPNLMPFTLATIGLMYSGAKGGSTNTDFAAGLNFGLKYLLNERAGIRIQARVQAPLSGIGLGVGVGTGGVGVGVGSYSNSAQFDLSGGVFVRF